MCTSSLLWHLALSQGETEGDSVNCESDPGKLGSLSVSSYSPYSTKAIHYVPLKRFMTIIGTALSRFRVSWSTGYGIRQPLRHLGAVPLQARLPHIRF